jgi:hypothetical protein
MKDAIIMVKLCLVFASGCILYFACPVSATIVDFEDLSERDDISHEKHYDIYWELGNKVGGLTGSWAVPDYPSDPSIHYYTYPHSGTRSLTNSWGCTQIGFQFQVENFEYGAIVSGAWFAVHGFESNWAKSVQARGYKEDREIWLTEPLILTSTPQWLAMDQTAVDRVVIITTPKEGKTSGGFCMDDLSFEEVIVPEPATLLSLTLGAAFMRRRK